MVTKTFYNVKIGHIKDFYIDEIITAKELDVLCPEYEKPITENNSFDSMHKYMDIVTLNVFVTAIKKALSSNVIENYVEGEWVLIEYLDDLNYEFKNKNSDF